jgi:hypothetical protein
VNNTVVPRVKSPAVSPCYVPREVEGNTCRDVGNGWKADKPQRVDRIATDEVSGFAQRRQAATTPFMRSGIGRTMRSCSRNLRLKRTWNSNLVHDRW